MIQMSKPESSFGVHHQKNHRTIHRLPPNLIHSNNRNTVAEGIVYVKVVHEDSPVEALELNEEL
jgi:hypothetical protein